MVIFCWFFDYFVKFFILICQLSDERKEKLLKWTSCHNGWAGFMVKNYNFSYIGGVAFNLGSFNKKNPNNFIRKWPFCIKVDRLYPKIGVQ